MKTSFGAALLCLMFLILPPASAAQGIAAEAVAMTKRAVAQIKASGNDKAFADIANPANTSFHDSIRSFIDVATSAAGSGWVEYQWPNPTINMVEPKAGYVERTGELIVGAGIYK